jgi:hypothetical protein
MELLIVLEGLLQIQAITIFVRHTFSNFQYHFKIILHCSNDNSPATIE